MCAHVEEETTPAVDLSCQAFLAQEGKAAETGAAEAVKEEETPAVATAAGFSLRRMNAKEEITVPTAAASSLRRMNAKEDITVPEDTVPSQPDEAIVMSRTIPSVFPDPNKCSHLSKHIFRRHQTRHGM